MMKRSIRPAGLLREYTAGRDVENWKEEKIPTVLYVLLIGSITALFICWMILIWEKIPGAIHIRAGIRQDLDLNVPVSGKLYKAPAETEGWSHPRYRHECCGRCQGDENPLRGPGGASLPSMRRDIETYTMDLSCSASFLLKR